MNYYQDPEQEQEENFTVAEFEAKAAEREKALEEKLSAQYDEKFKAYQSQHAPVFEQVQRMREVFNPAPREVDPIQAQVQEQVRRALQPYEEAQFKQVQDNHAKANGFHDFDEAEGLHSLLSRDRDPAKRAAAEQATHLWQQGNFSEAARVLRSVQPSIFNNPQKAQEVNMTQGYNGAGASPAPSKPMEDFMRLSPEERQGYKISTNPKHREFWEQGMKYLTTQGQGRVY